MGFGVCCNFPRACSDLSVLQRISSLLFSLVIQFFQPHSLYDYAFSGLKRDFSLFQLNFS